ncbi:MAG TPA: chloride channel protein [Thermoanaerobaculia bacterium]|nr:chloride channel protein [Thermoanaerobaculia bacterium]
MPDPTASPAGTKGGLAVAPSLETSLLSARVPSRGPAVGPRTVTLSAWAIAIGLAAGLVARALVLLIGLITNLSFHQRFSFTFASPEGHHLGAFVIAVPVLGGLIVGVMARFGSKAIRGHGIPEAMEQVLLNRSRIPPRVTFLKPLSAAVAIGTGGPFGAEGPIIATGGALGSLLGQIVPTTAVERKILLASGAAAGMAATFGSPVSAVLLAIELLLFEFRARSLVPVALASAAATGMRYVLVGSAPVFPMPAPATPGGGALALYVLLGALVGIAAVGATRAVYAVEDAFEQLPIHWMWWPALGALAVGVIGYFRADTMGVGYVNIEKIVSAQFTLEAVAALGILKFLSWAISLGSGTSGGTLAPLFTIGGALGALLGAGLAQVFPAAGIDLRIAALVGMAAIFAGASRALLTSVVFAFETTLQPLGLLPLLGGCTAAYLVSSLLMRESIMTEKISRRGVRVPADYEADFLGQVLVRDACAKDLVTLPAEQTLEAARAWIASRAPGSAHQGFPVVDARGALRGVLTRRNLLDPATDGDRRLGDLIGRPPAAVFEDSSLREAADHMVREDVGRLPVIDRSGALVGIVTRGDLLAAHRERLAAASDPEPGIWRERADRESPTVRR